MKEEVTNYFKNIPEKSKPRVKELEEIIDSIVGKHDIEINYGIPTVYKNGKRILHYGGYENFISLYPMGHVLIEKYKKELLPYKTSRGTIQFQNSEPLPKELIRKIIKDCLSLD